MGSYAEEQEMELEALTSIFEEGKEFDKLSATEFKLKLVPHPGGEDENHVGFTLHVTYTETYPETAPDWEIEEIKGLPEKKVAALKEKIEEAIEASLGMAMIYSVAEACQEYLKENNEKELSMHEEMLRRAKEDGKGGEDEEEDEEDYEDDGDDFAPSKEEEEWKGLAEKPVVPEAERITKDQFIEWKNKFEEEMIAAGVLKRDVQKAKTGRQIFMEASGKEGEASEKKEGAEAAGEDKKDSTLVYNPELFGEGDDDDDDLEDLSDGDED
mmetsp:Transcript_9870/g.14734  ORF Transcript_9870/g.14734 Transcript_9870/m.14734 type:complete len:270 (+) Transcript_9870:112-921(+)